MSFKPARSNDEKGSLTVPARYPVRTDSSAGNAAPASRCDSTALLAPARDLLSRGIQGRQGIGDVQVRPSPAPAGGEPSSVLNIQLISPYGQARFETPAREVTDFLRRANQIVPTARKAATSTSTPN
jgi:hypothetical protein